MADQRPGRARHLPRRRGEVVERAVVVLGNRRGVGIGPDEFLVDGLLGKELTVSPFRSRKGIERELVVGEEFLAGAHALFQQVLGRLILVVPRLPGGVVGAVVFAVGAVTSVAMLSSTMLFVLNRKKREMNVYYSLGQSKERILMKYAGYYCFIGMFAAVIGFIIAYSISQLLFTTLVKNSGDIQYELMQLSVNGNETISNASIQLDSIRLSEIVKAALMSCICLIIIIFVMVSCSMKSILRGSLRDKINGGM